MGATNLSIWRVYLLACADGTLYTGIAKDVARRLDAHNAGKGAKYTRGRRPTTLLAQTHLMTRSEALRLEARVKRMDKAAKLAAILAAIGHNNPLSYRCPSS